MVDSLVFDENFMIAYRSKTYCGLKIPLLDRIVIRCLGAIGYVIGIGGGDVPTRVGGTSVSLVPSSGCVGIISIVGEPCEEGRGAMVGVRSC